MFCPWRYRWHYDYGIGIVKCTCHRQVQNFTIQCALLLFIHYELILYKFEDLNIDVNHKGYKVILRGD